MSKKKEQEETRKINRLFILVSKRTNEGEEVSAVLGDIKKRYNLTDKECEILLSRFEELV